MILDQTLPFAAATVEDSEQVRWSGDLASRSKSRTTESDNGSNTLGPIAEASQDVAAASRKRRAHRKSRRGCENCKLRRVKCDEGRPICQKCSSYGVDCGYDYQSPNKGLMFAGESTFTLQHSIRSTPSTSTLILNDMNSSLARRSPSSDSSSGDDGVAPFKWLPSDLVIMSRFQERTVLTVGTPTTAKLYQNEIFKMATNYPFLTHVVLTLTLMHDRHLAGTSTIGERAAMHWLQGTAMFQDALIRPKQQAQKDALWASAALLGCIQFAAIEARTPEEAWPLKQPSPEDLDWMKMSTGKRAVWNICQPHRVESVFSKLKGHPDLYRPLYFDKDVMKNMTADFCELYQLGPDSSDETNPYHTSAMLLARLLHVECSSDTILDFLSFTSQMQPELKVMIEQKEPKSLLLIAFWFAKIYRYQWWLHRRGLLEGSAICIYIDRYYGHAETIHKLLKWPKMLFGLAFGLEVEGSLRQWTPLSTLEGSSYESAFG